MSEQKSISDVSHLNHVIMTINAYYQDNNKYPTTPEFYLDPSNCELILEKVNSEIVSLYCGIIASRTYHIKFTENGNVEFMKQ